VGRGTSCPTFPRTSPRLGPSGLKLRPFGPRSSVPPHFWLPSAAHALLPFPLTCLVMLVWSLIFTRAIFASMVYDVLWSVWCRTKVAKCKITKTMLHDGPRTLSFMLQKISTKYWWDHPRRGRKTQVRQVKITFFPNIWEVSGTDALLLKICVHPPWWSASMTVIWLRDTRRTSSKFVYNTWWFTSPLFPCDAAHCNAHYAIVEPIVMTHVQNNAGSRIKRGSCRKCSSSSGWHVNCLHYLYNRRHFNLHRTTHGSLGDSRGSCVTGREPSTGTYDKVTICPRFSGTVPIFSDMFWNKSQFSMPNCPVFGLVSWICPDLPISAATHRWLIISSDFLYIWKNRWRSGIHPGPHWGSSRRSSRPPKSDLNGSCMWRSHPMIRTFGTRPGLRCPNYGHLNIGCGGRERGWGKRVVFPDWSQRFEFPSCIVTVNWATAVHQARSNYPEDTVLADQTQPGKTKSWGHGMRNTMYSWLLN